MSKRKRQVPKYRRKTLEDYFALIGTEYERLLITGVACPLPKGLRKTVLAYKCICGNTGLSTLAQLTSGKTRSCGCLHNELLSKLKTTHGQAGKKKTLLYTKWKNARNRCNNPAHPKYHNYGGRGITLHPDFEDYVTFEGYLRSLYPNLDDLIANRYQLDREDCDGDYTYGNLRLVTNKVNSNNRTNHRYVDIFGEHLTLSLAADKYAVVPPGMIRGRLERGWSILESVLLPRLPTRGRQTIRTWSALNFPGDIVL